MSTDKTPRPGLDSTGGGKIIGILGGIGSGKSTVAEAFSRRGAQVLDADQIAHKLLEEKDIKKAVSDRFGEDVLTPDGEIDRRALRKVFEDPEQLRDLEEILHPPVIDRIREAVRLHRESPQERPPLVLDVPLLVEKGLHPLVDVLVFVDTPRSIRLSRLHRRSGIDEAELSRREKLQSSINFKRDLADYKIDCSKTRNSTENQVLAVWERISGSSSD